MIGTNNTTRRIRVLLADDHEMVRVGLRSILEKSCGATVVAEAEDGRTAVRLARELAPEVAFLDITMPGLNGIEATREIRETSPGTRIIAVSMYSDRQFVSEILRAGASGYLLKNGAAREVGPALDAVLAGRVFLSPSIAEVVVDAFVRRPAEQTVTPFDLLSGREREVLQLLAEGLTNKEIASNLNLGTKTVETHRAQLMEKLKIHTVAGLTKYAIRHGLTPLEA
jgi:DNA-binding NarL/FixJ family response regulator